MRAERMIATLLLMQSQGRITARELADELEISVATARRDLEALAVAGVPVYPQPGRGGGWSLVGGARTDLSGLTAPEAQALFGLIGSTAQVAPAMAAAETSSPGASSSQAPSPERTSPASTSPEVASAVRKLLRALPGTFRADAAAAAAAVRLDDVRWGELATERPAAVDMVRQAVVDRLRIRIDYSSRTGAARSRTVEVSPLGLVAKDRLWYLIALPAGAEETRTYRMDRVRSVAVTDAPAERPADFDLTREWQRVVDFVEARRSLVQARVRVRRGHLWVLRDHFGRYLEVVRDSDDGDGGVEGDDGGGVVGDDLEVIVAAHTARSVAEQLAGWGAAIDVLAPDEVREELARIGAELTAAYGG